jgi:O-antigen/teichoic acid export membrane protein
LFLTASRLGSKVLGVVLFWIPALFVSARGFGLVALFTYGWMHFRKA